MSSSRFVASTFEFHGHEVHFRFREGRGRPLVLLSGLSDSMDSWNEVLGILPALKPILLIDLLGQGETLEAQRNQGLPTSKYQFTAEEQAQLVFKIMSFLKLAQVDLVGFSYGGGVALCFAGQHPSKVHKLILMMPFILRLDLAFLPARYMHWQNQLMMAVLPGPLSLPWQMAEKFYDRFIENYMDFRFKNRIRQNDLRQIAIQVSKGMMKFDSFKIIHRLKNIPVYLVSSEVDTLIPDSLMREFWARLPKSSQRTWKKLRNGDHLIVEQSPQFVSQTILEYLVETDLKTNVQLESVKA